MRARPGNGIEIKKGQYQGGLFAGKNVDATVTGTVVQGPMISVYGNVSAGQGGELSFPPISFPTSGRRADSPARCPCPSCWRRAASAAAEMHRTSLKPRQRYCRKDPAWI